MARKKFMTLFPECTNVHLTKDVGMIPSIFARELGYESEMACYENGEYPDAEYLHMRFLNTKRRDSFQKYFKDRQRILSPAHMFYTGLKIFDCVSFVFSNAKSIDVLELYHPTLATAITGLAFRLLNPKGKLYVKMDFDPSHIDTWKGKAGMRKWISVARILASHFLVRHLARPHVISAETKKAAEFLKCEYIPNGFDSKMRQGGTKKEDIILHVGRIGAAQKGTWMLMQAFSHLAEFGGWRLVMIGPKEKDFAIPQDKRIEYLGFLDPKEKLYGYYRRAKILAFPSLYESFAMPPLEAGFFGGVIVGTNIPCIYELTDGGKLGYLCDPNDVEGFTRNLRTAMEDRNLEALGKKFSQNVCDNYDWNKICARLEVMLKNKPGDRDGF